jgi:hypothetical protein
MAFARRPDLPGFLIVLLLLPALIRLPLTGVYADGEGLRVRTNMYSFTASWAEVSGFAIRRSRALFRRKVTEAVWIELHTGERYPMVGVWPYDEIGLALLDLVSRSGATQLLSQLQERHRAAMGEITAGHP